MYIFEVGDVWCLSYHHQKIKLPGERSTHTHTPNISSSHTSCLSLILINNYINNYKTILNYTTAILSIRQHQKQHKPVKMSSALLLLSARNYERNVAPHHSASTTSTTRSSVTTSFAPTPRNSTESNRAWTRRNALTPEPMSLDSISAALAEVERESRGKHSKSSSSSSPSKRRRVLSWFAVNEEGRREMPGWEDDE